ncbi:hypothetical protein F2Q69_00029977 [Brassica cretica]|uniref:Uncharacterized protein n=1 Tax=Brassica cretica TaxID=69181 RepID=A0A8S9RXN4_BRACR|nr:hypothetical protein F2Q69_00029977 [Brassica cretica]
MSESTEMSSNSRTSYCILNDIPPATPPERVSTRELLIYEPDVPKSPNFTLPPGLKVQDISPEYCKSLLIFLSFRL